MRLIPLLTALSAACALAGRAAAQDAVGWIEELRELRKTVEQQSKQIDALTQQVSRLTALIENKSGPAKAQPAAAPDPEEFAPPTPVAKAEPAQPRHIVVKGDTLTSIAKQYNIPLTELRKANKEINEMKLQIGQTILLPPTTPTKNPEPEKKSNP